MTFDKVPGGEAPVYMYGNGVQAGVFPAGGFWQWMVYSPDGQELGSGRSGTEETAWQECNTVAKDYEP